MLYDEKLMAKVIKAAQKALKGSEAAWKYYLFPESAPIAFFIGAKVPVRNVGLNKALQDVNRQQYQSALAEVEAGEKCGRLTFGSNAEGETTLVPIEILDRLDTVRAEAKTRAFNTPQTHNVQVKTCIKPGKKREYRVEKSW